MFSTKMKTFVLAVLLIATSVIASPDIGIISGLVNETSGLPIAEMPTITGKAASYSGILRDTQGQAFYVSVRANNPKYNGHNVQLLSSNPASFVVVDLASPVLLLTLENGTLAAVGTNDFNEPYLLGGVGGLRNVTSNSTLSAQSFIFRNETSDAAEVFQETSRGWYLVGGGHSATYGLYQRVPTGLVNGFIICEMDDEIYQLFYYEYTGPSPDFGDECEFIALQTTVAPYV